MARASTFAADVAAWAQNAERAALEVAKQAVRIAVRDMTEPRAAGGHMPVVTGNLRNSLSASLAGPVRIDWGKKRQFAELGTIEAVLQQAEPGHTIFVGFKAPYAERVEFGDSGGFWRLTIQRWPQIVAEATAKVRGAGR